MKVILKAIAFIACSVFGIWAILKYLSPPLWSWLALAVVFLIYLVDSVRRLYVNRIIKWHESVRNIEELTLALGACYLAYKQLRAGEVLTANSFQSVKDHIAQALSIVARDQRLVDEFYDEARKVPSTIKDQDKWVDDHCIELRRLIASERQNEPLEQESLSYRLILGDDKK